MFFLVYVRGISIKLGKFKDFLNSTACKMFCTAYLLYKLRDRYHSNIVFLQFLQYMDSIEYFYSAMQSMPSEKTEVL